MTTAAVAFQVVAHREQFFELPKAERDEVIDLLHAMRRIASSEAGTVSAAREEALRQHGRRGWSRASLLRKFYSYTHSGGDWRALVDRSRNKDERQSLPPAFVTWWKSLCEENQRKCRPAYRKFVRLYQAGENIPGLGIRQPGRHDLPRGYTYSNLMRHAPTKFELTARRQGRSAAANYRPLVFSTRRNLAAGQFYVFDDLEHDVKVNLLGVNRVALRPLELGALDLFSGCKFAWGLKPMLVDDTDGSKQKLKEREMRFLLASLLLNHGYRPEGTTLLVEHGTAAVREDIERTLHDVTDGAIRIDRSGIEGAAAFAGAYCGRPKGNFRLKASLESHHNLVHNELAALPGQMGKGRDHAPEELHGRDRANERLIKVMAALPADRAQLLRLPFIPFDQFAGVVDFVYRLINERTDHDLEGFEEAGLIVNEFRLMDGSQWLPMSRLLCCSDEERRAIAAVIDRPGYVRARRMSPAEVWERGRPALVKFPTYAVPEILGLDSGVERRLGDDHLFEFEDRDVGPGAHRFLGIVRTAQGFEEQLVPGETYLTHVNPFDASLLFVSSPGRKAGAFIGVARRWDKVCKADTEALHRQMGAAAKIESDLLAPLAARGAAVIRQRIADAQHNALVGAGAPITPAEKAVAARIRAERGTLGDLIPDSSDQPSPSAEPSQPACDGPGLSDIF